MWERYILWVTILRKNLKGKKEEDFIQRVVQKSKLLYCGL